MLRAYLDENYVMPIDITLLPTPHKTNKIRVILLKDGHRQTVW